MHGSVIGAAMAHLDDAHAGVGIVQKFGLSLLQNLKGHGGGACIKIISPNHNKNLLIKI